FRNASTTGRRVETALKRLMKKDNGIQALFVEDLKMSGFDKGLRHKGGWLLFDCVKTIDELADS
nr:hypothetical protein [Tanacetum cinerariifolium]